MNNKTNYARWRMQFLRVAFIASIIIFVIEFLSIFFYYGQGLTAIDTDITRGEYIIYYFALPSGLNLLNVLVCYLILKNDKVKENIRNYISILTVAIVAAITMSVHHVFPPLICCMAVIIPLTTVFGDTKMTNFFYFMAFPFIILSYFLAINGYTKDDPNLLYNYIISIALITCTYLGSISIVYFQKERFLQIEESYQKELELHERLKLDQLTGLYNHSTIHQILYRVVNDFNMKKIKSLALAMIDIDDFKRVNDTYGHLNGDIVLQELSKLLREHSDDQIICSRYGGEEFAIIFVNKDIDEALSVLKSISKEFATKHYDFSGGIKITISTGLAEYSNPVWSSEKFFTLADAALYVSKGKGKNCISFADESGHEDD